MAVRSAGAQSTTTVTLTLANQAPTPATFQILHLPALGQNLAQASANAQISMEHC